MDDYIKQALFLSEGYGPRVADDKAVQDAAAAVLEALRGLNYGQAQQSLSLASNALNLAASVPR